MNPCFFNSLEGFSKLKEVKGNFICEDNLELDEYDGFENLDKNDDQIICIKTSLLGKLKLYISDINPLK